MIRSLPHRRSASDSTGVCFLTLLATALGSCSGGGSSPGPTAPPVAGAAVTGALQDRVGDDTGATLLVTFDTGLVEADAETASRYSVGTLTVNTAELIAPTIVRLTLDGPAVPGDVTLAVSAGIEDVDGNLSSAASGVAITSNDVTPPAASGLSAAAISGADNDQVTVTFDDDLVEADVESTQRWAIESPLGTAVDLTGAQVEYAGATRSATLTLAGGQALETSDDVAVVLTGVRDIGGNPIELTTFGVDAVAGTVEGDVTPPQLLAVYPGQTANTLRYVFDEPVKYTGTADLVGAQPVSGTRFTFAESTAPGVTITGTSSVEILGGLGAEVTFPVQPEAGDAAALYGVADLAGNVMEPVASVAVIARDEQAPEIAAGGVTITAVSGERNDVLSVTFDRPVHPDGLLDPARYGLLFGFFEELGGARGTWNGSDRVDFVLEGVDDHVVQEGGAYILAVVRFRSLQGVPVDEISSEGGIVGVGDATPPSVLSARVHPAATTDLIIEFDEAIRADVSAAAAAFEAGGQAATSASLLAPRVVRVSFPSAPTVGASLDVGAAALTDLAGNEAVATASVTIQAADATNPTILSTVAEAVAGSAPDRVVITLSESVTSADLTASNLTLLQDSAPLDLTGATLRYSSIGRTVTVTLAEGVTLTRGATLDAVFSALVDHSGNAALLVTDSATVGGDAVPPAALSAFVNHREATDSTVVDVTADEALDGTADSAASWSASGGQTVVGVTRVSPERLRVTLSASLGAGDTLTLIGATDLAGNAAAGPLVVDPAE